MSYNFFPSAYRELAPKATPALTPKPATTLAPRPQLRSDVFKFLDITKDEFDAIRGLRSIAQGPRPSRTARVAKPPQPVEKKRRKTQPREASQKLTGEMGLEGLAPGPEGIGMMSGGSMLQPNILPSSFEQPGEYGQAPAQCIHEPANYLQTSTMYEQDPQQYAQEHTKPAYRGSFQHSPVPIQTDQVPSPFYQEAAQYGWDPIEKGGEPNLAVGGSQLSWDEPTGIDVMHGHGQGLRETFDENMEYGGQAGMGLDAATAWSDGTLEKTFDPGMGSMFDNVAYMDSQNRQQAAQHMDPEAYSAVTAEEGITYWPHWAAG